MPSDPQADSPSVDSPLGTGGGLALGPASKMCGREPQFSGPSAAASAEPRRRSAAIWVIIRDRPGKNSRGAGSSFVSIDGKRQSGVHCAVWRSLWDE